MRRLVLLSAVLLAASVVMAQQHIQKLNRSPGGTVAPEAEQGCWYMLDMDNADAMEIGGQICFDCDTNTSGAEDCFWQIYFKQDGVLLPLAQFTSDPFEAAFGVSGDGSVKANGKVTIVSDDDNSGAEVIELKIAGTVRATVTTAGVSTASVAVATTVLTPTASAPTCGAGQSGTIYVNSTPAEDVFCFCNGTDWQEIPLSGDNDCD